MSKEGLTVGDYVAATKELFGYQPFRWQQTLLGQIIEQGQWPDVIDMPTGTGKTSAIDIALFHLAVNPQVLRRICFVVDRRIVVDAAFQRACKLAGQLKDAVKTDSSLGRWARALQELGGGGIPLQVERMRGGMPLARSQVTDPRQPMVVTATVDQIGSRLLFRGYGCSPNSWPIHAAMFGMDSLILLDEAHLSEPFRETIERVAQLQGHAPEASRLPAPVRCVRLSATVSGAKSKTVFPASPQDKTGFLQEEVIRQRIQAAKPTRVIAAKNKPVNDIVATAQEMMTSLLDVYAAPAVAVVVNRIATARDIFNQLQKKKAKSVDLVLWIGRNRPYERDKLVAKYSSRLAAGREVPDSDQPVFVVATQTIEVGADFDFQGMVSEVASWDALRQRFGRLDRLGRFGQAQGAIVGSDKPDQDDPIYGVALVNTWKYLQSLQDDEGSVDLSVEKLMALDDQLSLEQKQRLARQPGQAATLGWPLVELLCQTSPSPKPDLEVANFLHGFDRGEPEIRLVFRAGIPLMDLKNDDELVASIDPSQEAKETFSETLAILPPTSAEALTLTRSATKAWLLRRCRVTRTQLAELSDDEGAHRVDDPMVRTKLMVWVWEDNELVARDARRLSGGELLIVPCEWGGCDRFGVAPDCDEPVADIAEGARVGLKHAAVRLLEPERLIHVDWLQDSEQPSKGQAAALALRKLLTRLNDGSLDQGSAVHEFRQSYPEAGLGNDIDDTIDALRRTNDEIYALTLTEKKPKAADLSDENGLSYRTVPVPLEEHSAGVAAMAAYFVENLLLDGELKRDVEHAGLLHDIGKAEDRFQWMLRSHSPAKFRAQYLAKSARSRGRAPIALGERHEAYSVSLIQQNPGLLDQGYDTELAFYLVGSHHGYGRPFMPDPEDAGVTFEVNLFGHTLKHQGKPGLGGLGAGWPERFWRLIKRFGPWGLAYLEALLRLADQQRSVKEVEEAKEVEADAA